MTTPKYPNLRPSEAGFILPLVLIIVAIGAMVVIGLLGYASGLLRAGGEDADALRELYAADAGVAHVKKLLEQGPLPTVIPPIEINGLEVKMVVTPVGSPGSAVPTPQPRPIDPEVPEKLNVPHPVTLNSVPEGTKVDISWAFENPTPTPTATPTPTSILTPIPPNSDGDSTDTPDTVTPTSTPTPTPTVNPSITIYGNDDSAIAISEPPLFVRESGKRWSDLPDVKLGEDGTYIVYFDPGTLTDLMSFPFTTDEHKCLDKLEPHFCMSTPPMDYIVVSTAGETTVTAYLRQTPRWTLESDVRVIYTFSGGGDVITLSWKPYPPDE